MLLVFIGGMAGTLCRYWLDGIIPTPRGLPLPTLAINLFGSFLLGLLLEALLRTGEDRGKRLMVRVLAGTGFLGGFTTYSAFAIEAIELGANGDYSIAAGYVGLSLVGGILMSFAGIGVGAAMTRSRHDRGPSPVGRSSE
ncbi:CrcB family protein [Arthrobacter sp. H20]|uniref:fluoride efflux transporter FluC n=1 Tax=Arthrobacter sp. H20 TaxID=1267981 RepID=UPI0023B82727|nr:CrcB family protein [Arthrobacter sp. H20]